MTNATYFVSYAGTNWVKTSAQNLTQAKRAASSNCIFQGQDLFVGTGDAEGLNITVVAKKSGDKMNMAKKGAWENV